MMTRVFVACLLACATAITCHAQKAYDPGASDTEIRIGNIMPYSGPASAYAVIGKTQAAYFRMINDGGGVNGRKINFISYDDGYSPPKTVEQARRLVENDEVLLIMNPLGTPGNSAIRKYMNDRKVPHLFVGSGASKWNDPANFPWTIGWAPSYRVEAGIYARYIRDNLPGKTIGVLYQNDDLGKDYLAGLKDGLGEASQMIVAERAYDVASPTIDSPIVQIRSASPDIFINIATPKFAALAIRKIGEIGWAPVQFLASISSSVGGVLKPAGLNHATGILSTAYQKDQHDPQWADDAGLAAWRDFMRRYYPDGDADDGGAVFGYSIAQGLVQVLRQCGDDLTRANVMRQAANLDMTIDVYLPGIRIKTGPDDFAPIEQMEMMRFNGTSWSLFGPMISAAPRP